MKLNRNNYEEYFILYLDNELSPEDRAMVEEFVAHNADLKAELDSLAQIKLSPDDAIVFENKESLMFADKSAVNPHNYEEWLLSSIDNELNAEQTRELQSFLENNAAARKELTLLQQAKLTPEKIIFPYKESLYRREEKARVFHISWKRIAVAAVLLIGISTTTVMLVNNRNTVQTDVATVDNGKKPLKNDIEQTPVVKQEAAGQLAKSDNVPAQLEDDHARQQKIPSNEKIKHGNRTLPVVEPVPSEKLLAKSEVDKKPTNNLPQPLENPNVRNDQEMNNVIAQATPNKNSSLTNPNVNSDVDNVTSPPAESYNDQEIAPVTADNPDVILTSNDGKKNKHRGIFRKITRTFEKRTNMKASDGDEDDRFRIAGLAIKLN